MKICSKCGRELDDSCFYKSKRNKSGLRSLCKECERKYAIEHKEQMNEASRRYREKHRERYLELARARDRKRAESRKEHQREYRRNRREKYPDIIREQKRKSYLLHREDILKKEKIYAENRIKNDELFKFKKNLRVLIGNSLNRNGFGKDTSTQDILGCSFDEAKTHLEETWLKNYGTIYNGEPAHIDHIIPLATAKTKEEAVRLCHISNLQYLKPEDNLRKSAKLEYEL